MTMTRLAAAGRAYFAYGSNMDVAQMRRRCPSAHLVGVGYLPGHRFFRNSRGVASIAAEVDSHVLGLEWIIDYKDELELDRFEGVPIHYKRYELMVESMRGSARCLTYIANDCRRGIPRPQYLERIIIAAQSARLDQAYIEELQTWSA